MQTVERRFAAATRAYEAHLDYNPGRLDTVARLGYLDLRRVQRAAVIIRPSTLLKFHNLLKQRKCRLLYSASRKAKPGPKGPSRELIQAIVAMKQRNPRFGCPRIAQQINKAFGVDIDKDVVRRVLAAHYRPGSGNSGPSWLSFLGHAKDSLWSIDLFRCESIHLKSHWVRRSWSWINSLGAS